MIIVRGGVLFLVGGLWIDFVEWILAVPMCCHGHAGSLKMEQDRLTF
jgi:hypothetical protein